MKKLLLASLMLGTVGAYAQTKKVIIEDYTGLHCGWCPEGTVILEGLQAANPTCIPIAIHTGSYEPAGSAINAGTVGSAIIGATQPAGYPNGSVDRKKYTGTTISMGRGSWTAAFNVQKAKTAIASVSFSNMKETSAGVYEADVNVKFTAAPEAGTPLKVQVYVIEDSISASGALAQDNYSTNVQSGASPLNPWWHNRTFRAALGGATSTPDAWGWSTVVPATPVVNTTYTKHISVTKDASWVKKNLHFVAYVAYDGAASADKKEILNAEEISLKAFHMTGVANVNSSNIVSAYPNPARVNDVISVEYNAPATGNVTMRVMNAVGQVVAVPYNSYDVEGAHTIKWRAADYNLPAGMYIMQIATVEGTSVQKINIY